MTQREIEQIDAYLILSAAHFHVGGAHNGSDDNLILDARSAVAREMTFFTKSAAIELSSLMDRRRFSIGSNWINRPYFADCLPDSKEAA